jgi:hypothetical protein
LEAEGIAALSTGLSEKIVNAIAKSPKWIQQKLAMQFQAINDEDYADLILDADIKYVDEIAFCIACSSVGNVPSADVIKNNVLTLYENDRFLKYADIVDYDNGFGNYYSTVKYRVIENGSVKEFEFPPEIYYWYIVHPQLTSENPVFIYGKFWRDFLFNHNDLGYPLLKEKLSNINYLWDCKSYFQEKNRTWNWSITNHPTAVEVISYWVGKTVTQQAYGDRPNQPNIIAHEHNGWCGELQVIATAALRTAMIPSIGIFDQGEDHVWREFYERGWHENDNWWADGGGAVDKPFVYAYDWGKNISALLAKKGDDSIYDVTSNYIKPNDRVTVGFKLFDRLLNPVDGARVVVTVTGPKDITWIKNRFFEVIEKVWDFIPEVLKIKIVEKIYKKINERISKIPDSVNGPINCIWNYTDLNGNCFFELGKNRSYFFIIQYGNLKKPMFFARFNTYRFLQNPKNKNFVIFIPFITPVKQRFTNLEMPQGDVFFNVSFDSKSYQIQKTLSSSQDKGVYERKGRIDFFIVDQENFEKYKQNKKYDCYNFLSNSETDIFVSAPKNTYYFVFKNNGRTSNIILNFTITVEMVCTDEKVQIVSPFTNVFEKPIFNVGEKIMFYGIATNNVTFYINHEPHEINVTDYQWFYVWETSGFSPGNYSIEAVCENAEDKLEIILIDKNPPIIEIDSPIDQEIIETRQMVIYGKSFDNRFVEKVEVSVGNSNYCLANGTNFWSITWDLSELVLGIYNISVKASDVSGCVSYKNITFVFNETGQSWGPVINLFYHEPAYPNSESNVVVYANVSTNSSFLIKKIVLYWNDGFSTQSAQMFRYADNPVLDRHEEDPFKNEPNNPLYGFELGQFIPGLNVSYWIEAYDSANNRKISETKNFFVNSF